MKHTTKVCLLLLTALAVLVPVTGQTGTADKPNIILIVSDDTGYGDLGPYGGGAGRGMPTPNIDRLAEEGMTFFAARRAARPSRRGAFPTAAA